MMKYIVIVLFSCFLIHNGFGQVLPPAGIGDDQNIILWLSPDSALYRKNGNDVNVGENVVTWRDISSNGFEFNSVKKKRPVLQLVDNKRYLSFSGGDFLLNSEIANTINGLDAFSIFIEIKSNVTNTDNGVLYSTDSPNEADEGLCIRYDAGGANTGRDNVIKSGFQGNTQGNQIETTENTQTTNVQVLTLTWVKGGKIYSYLDGIPNDSSSSVLNTSLSGVESILLGKGAKDEGDDEGWDGYIGTVIFYNEKFDDAIVEEIAVDITKITSINDGNWSDPATWSCDCVPNDSRTVFIKNNHVVTMDISPSVGALYIDNSSSLNMATNTLTLTKGDLIVDGTIQGEDASLSFTSSEKSQLINVPNTSFANITLTNDLGLAITGGVVSINNLLTLDAGVLTTNDKLIFAGTTTTGAYLAEVGTGANISGKVIYQYYKNSVREGWRYWSMPLTGVSVADFQEEVAVTGSFDNPSTGAGINSTRNSIYSYDAVNQAYSSFPKTGNSADSYFTLGTGYSIWVMDDSSDPEISEVTGTPHIGDITYNLEYTNSPTFEYNGWNLIGNPYLSAVDWDAIPLSRKVNMSNAIYMTDNIDEAGRIDRSYVNGIGVPASTTNIIAPSQAVWVQTTSSGASITFNESDKVQSSYVLYKVKPLGGIVRFVVQNEEGYEDEFVVRFNEESTMNFDYEFDALQFEQNHFYASSTGDDDIEMDINNVPFDESSAVKILLSKLTKGEYSISISEFSLDSPAFEVVFLDVHNNVEIPLNELSNFTFAVDTETELKDRFVLVTREKKTEEVTESNLLKLAQSIIVYPNPTVDKKIQVRYSNLSEEQLMIELVNVLGEVVFQKEFSETSTSGVIDLDLQGFESGVLQMVIRQGNKTQVERIVLD